MHFAPPRIMSYYLIYVANSELRSISSVPLRKDLLRWLPKFLRIAYGTIDNVFSAILGYMSKLSLLHACHRDIVTKSWSNPWVQILAQCGVRDRGEELRSRGEPFHPNKTVVHEKVEGLVLDVGNWQ